MAAVACGGLCATPPPGGTPVRRGNAGDAGKANGLAVNGDGSGVSKTNGVAANGDGSGFSKTNGVAANGDGRGVSKTNGFAVGGDGGGVNNTGSIAVGGDGGIGEKGNVAAIGGKWTGIGTGDETKGIAFRAIALGLSEDGAWVVRTAPSLVSAVTGALQACSEQFGQCTLSDAQVAPTHFGCLVVIQSDDASRVFAAAGDSSDLARAAAAAQIATAGLRGEIVFTGCNS